MNLLWSFSTLGCPTLSFDEVIELAHDYAMRGVEIRCLDANIDLLQGLRKRFDSPSFAEKECQNLSVPIVALNSSCRMLGQQQSQWDELVELAPWADAMGVPSIRVFDGKAKNDSTFQECIHEARAFFDWWRKMKQEHSWTVDLIIETHSSLTTSARIREFIEALDSPAPLLWDSHHTWFKGGEDPVATWKAIQPWVRHIHVKDSPKPITADDKVSYVLPALGEFPLLPFLNELEGARFTGPVSLEWEKQWHPELPNLQEALEKCRSYGWW